jgi:hypothetical protein
MATQLSRTLRWRPLDGVGLEHLELLSSGDEIRARSVVIGEREGVAFGARYEVVCDRDWRFRSLLVERNDGRILRLVSDGEGHWRDAVGSEVAALEGCIDIDLSASPFTNTLPIRRCGLSPAHGTVNFRMAYVPFDTLDPFAEGQLYTALDGHGRFRFQEEDGTFEAELTVDAEGFVLSYPPLYERVRPLASARSTTRATSKASASFSAST